MEPRHRKRLGGSFGLWRERGGSRRQPPSCSLLPNWSNRAKSRSAAEAVAMLIHACRMGPAPPDGQAPRLDRSEHRPRASLYRAGGTPSISSCCSGTRASPLEAHQLAEIPVLIKAAYERACYLAQDLTQIPADELDHALGAFKHRARVTAARTLPACWTPHSSGNLCKRVTPNRPVPSLLLGGAAGLLYGAGHLAEDALLGLVAGPPWRAPANDPAAKISFLRGLLHTSRELALAPAGPARNRGPAFLNAWSEEEFIQALPELRLSLCQSHAPRNRPGRRRRRATPWRKDPRLPGPTTT